MADKSRVKSDEELMIMQELDDRLKEHIDKLEHIRLAAVQLRENLSGNNSDLSQSISDHVDWLKYLTERVETLHMKTNVFVQMNPKRGSWTGKRSSKHSYRWGRSHQKNDTMSEVGWSPIHTRRNSDAASEMSCNW